MSTAAKAVAAELEAKRNKRVEILAELERAEVEVRAALGRRQEITQLGANINLEITALEKALELIDPNNDKH